MKHDHILEIWGDFACFTRPELSVERVSYPVITPSAARSIFEAIYFKPQFRWQITKVELLSYPQFIGLRRNEVKDKVSTNTVSKWMKGTQEPEPLWADGDKNLLGTDTKGRTQRQTMALRDPHFRIHGHIVPRESFETKIADFDKQFVRRASNGKCFHQPYMGCREFVAFFRHLTSLENEPTPITYNQDLGLMLYDVFDLSEVNNDQTAASVSLFRAKIEQGVLEVPTYESELVLKPERQVS